MSAWVDFENSVRQYAQYIWNRPAIADRIGGVNFDCIVKISEIEIVAIEITKNKTLEKNKRRYRQDSNGSNGNDDEKHHAKAIHYM